MAKTCISDGCDGTVLARGWCRNCYYWSRRNGWADPSGRTDARKTGVNVGRCKAGGCITEGRLTKGWCDACYQWSYVNNNADPSGRKRHRSSLEGLTCVVVDESGACPRKPHTGDLCSMHSKRLARHGDPTRISRRTPRALIALIEEAAATTAITCFIVPDKPYSWQLHLNGVWTIAARAVWAVAHGDPGDSYVLHKCNGGDGSTGCINPHHLYLGSLSQNSTDKANAMRQVVEGHANAKLTNGQALEIIQRHNAGELTIELAAEFGIHPRTVRDIASGRRWKRLPGRERFDS